MARSSLITVWLCAVMLGCVRAHLYGQHSSNTGVSGSRQLMCHDCSGSDCLRLISKGWGGWCQTRKGLPKCFVRKDPNGLVYRGCADHEIWPDILDLDYNGCQTQRYGDWSEKKVIWCLCDYAYCNINITTVMQRYGERKPEHNYKPDPHYKPYVPLRYKPNPKNYVPERVRYPISRDIPPSYHVQQPRQQPRKQRKQQPRQTRRPQQKRIMFYKPRGYPDSQYVEPIDKPQPPRREPINNQPWYDVRTPAKNQPWIPPAREMSPRIEYYTTRSPPIQATQRVVFTTPPAIPAPTAAPPSMAQDIGPFESATPEGKIGGQALNDITSDFDLSKIPDWLWEKILPRLEEEEDPKNDVEQAPLRDKHTCQTMKCDHDCVVKKGHPYCICPAGYTLTKDGRTCEDEDECSRRNGDCNHVCRNTVGSYLCSCEAGYQLDVDQKTCQDFNECTMVTCQHTCRNTAGSYKCTCRPGYVINADGKTCDDVDECVENSHSCDHICVNTLGAYACDCHHGYHLDTNERTCRDSNECLVENGGCAQGCQNTAGSYECYCNRGYVLNVDGKTCDDVDECRDDNGGCTHTCWNLAGTYECRCNTGYLLDTDQHRCIDMNECLEKNGGCHQICENIHGSFRCLCREGSSLNVDQRTCDAIDKCSQDNGGCEHVCTTTPSGARCSCYQGYMLRTDAHSCADINECQRHNGGCNHICVNTVGSHWCRCRNGYTLNVDNVTCDDVDECVRKNGGCSQHCENVPGSHRCTCDTGYQLLSDGRQCQDINECHTENGGCQQDCTNLPGSFRCSCDGIVYRLHADGRRCIGTCPSDFVKNETLSSCYKVFTPHTEHEASMKYSQDVASAQEHCRSLHPLGGLVSIQTAAEKEYVSTLLKKETQMLEGWQGWWTSGSYHSGLNLFQWSDGTYISNDSPHWGFRKTPVTDTCVWVLQISVYNQTWGNYDCFTKSGHICEVELASK